MFLSVGDLFKALAIKKIISHEDADPEMVLYIAEASAAMNKTGCIAKARIAERRSVIKQKSAEAEVVKRRPVIGRTGRRAEP